MTNERLIERANKRVAEFNRLQQRYCASVHRANYACEMMERANNRAGDAGVRAEQARQKAIDAGVDQSLLQELVYEEAAAV